MADNGNHRIRSISPDGTVTTLAGGNPGYADRPAEVACFNNPNGVAIDADGHALVADTLNHGIRKIDADVEVTTVAGNGRASYFDDQGTSAGLNFPMSLAVDGHGNVIVLRR